MAYLGRCQPSQSWSQGSSSVNIVTHCGDEHGMRVISVPQKPALQAERVKDLPEIGVEVAVEVGVARIARRAGELQAQATALCRCRRPKATRPVVRLSAISASSVCLGSGRAA